MLTHCKNAIHCKTNCISIAWMLIHCLNNPTHCRFNVKCIACTLTHYENDAIHCKTNDICTAWMPSHCKNNAFQCKIKDICIPSSSRGVLDLALARSPENYQKRAPGLKNVLTYPTHTPSHGNSHDPQEEQVDLEKYLWPSCPWMKSCWRRPRQRTRLVRKCAVMFFFCFINC